MKYAFGSSLAFGCILFCGNTAYGEPAKPISYCTPVKILSAKTEDCSHNTFFASEANRCEAAFSDSVRKATASLPNLFSKSAGNAQSEGMKRSSHDYLAASGRLNDLIAKAEFALIDLNAYLDFLVWPEDAGDEDVTGAKLSDYLNRVPCFRDSRNTVNRAIGSFEKQLAELKRAKAASDLLNQGSMQHHDGLSSVIQQKTPVKKGSSDVPTPTPRPNYRSSDVTGTEETDSAR